MSLSVEVKINGKTIATYEATRVLTNGNRNDIDPDHVHTYRVQDYTNRPGHYDYVNHRYGNGASILAMLVLAKFNTVEV